jgi:hypothetical protein
MPVADHLEGTVKILTETIQQFTFYNWIIRVWVHEPSPEKFDKLKINDVARHVQQCHHTHTHTEANIYPENDFKSANALALRILEYPSVNAVEVKNPIGNGVVLYRDWP